MFTQKEKQILLGLLNNVPISGNRQTIPQIMEEIDALIRKVEAMPVEPETEPAQEKKK